MSTLPVRCVSALLRSFPNAPGAWRLAKYAVRQTRRHGAKLGSPVVKTCHGFSMQLQLDDWVDQHIFATGNYEDPTARTIAALLGPGDGSIDIGANIGFFSLLMSSRVGPNGSVVSFEPSPSTRKRLIRNVELNRATNITVREEAVSNVDGQSLFFGGSEHHSGRASLRPMEKSGGQYEVKTCRLASCLPPSFKPRLIKIDIEGAELLALSGMLDVLEAHHPDIVIEMSDAFLKQMGGSSAEVFAMLTKLDYTMYMIAWDGLIAHKSWRPTLPQQFNALFSARGALPQELDVKTVVD